MQITCHSSYQRRSCSCLGQTLLKLSCEIKCSVSASTTPNVDSKFDFQSFSSTFYFFPFYLWNCFFCLSLPPPHFPLHLFVFLPSCSSCSGASQRPPGASPSAHNISSATVSDRTNFPRGGVIRSTFHAGQQRGARDQQGSTYSGGPASPSLSHGNSQARRTHGATGIFSKFTSKFVRK